MNLGRPLMKGIPWILLLKLPETPKVSGPLISAYVELGSNYYTLLSSTVIKSTNHRGGCQRNANFISSVSKIVKRLVNSDHVQMSFISPMKKSKVLTLESPCADFMFDRNVLTFPDSLLHVLFLIFRFLNDRCRTYMYA